MSSYTKLNPSLTKRAIIICSLIAGVIIIGTVVTITTRNKSQEINSYQKYAFKMKLLEPYWVRFVDEDKSLVNAFVAGTNIKSEPIHVCRVNRIGPMEIIPGTYSFEKKSCIVTYDSFIHKHMEFEILVAEDPSILAWHDNDHASNGALIAGVSQYKYEYKIARVMSNDGDQHIGSLQVGRKEACAPFGHYVYTFSEYQFLCLNDYNLA